MLIHVGPYPFTAVGENVQHHNYDYYNDSFDNKLWIFSYGFPVDETWAHAFFRNSITALANVPH